MTIDTIIAGSMVGGALFLLLLRTHIALAIMSLCAGYVFADLLGNQIVTFIYANNYDRGSVPVLSVVMISLTFLPALLILWRFKRHQAGRFLQHLIPAFGFMILSALLVYEHLSFTLQQRIADDSVIFQEIAAYRLVIAAGVIVIAVFDIMLHEKEHKRKHKRARRKRKEIE